jgi:hypothetical protein
MALDVIEQVRLGQRQRVRMVRSNWRTSASPGALDDYLHAIGLPSGGAVRASLGLASNFADVDSFSAFAREFVDLAGVPDDLPPRVGC